MKVERSKNRLYYLDLDRVDPICDGFLVEEQRSAPFPHESTHVTQDIICESEQLGQPEESLENSRPLWPEGGGLKEKNLPEDPSEGSEKGRVNIPENRQDRSSSSASLIGPEEREISVAALKKKHARYVCLELLNLACTWVRYGQKNRPESNPSDKDLVICTSKLSSPSVVKPVRASRRPSSSCVVWPERSQDLGSDAREETRPEAPPGTHVLEKTGKGGGLNTLARKAKKEADRRQLAKEGVASATTSTKGYVVLAPIALELKQLRPMLTRMRCVLDYYSKEALRTVDNPVKMKQEKNCLLVEEPVKVKDDKKDEERQAMEKPAKAKTVTWMLQEGAAKAMSTMKIKTAKVMPRVTPTQSKWRIWDPGRSEAVVLRGVIVRIKHVRSYLVYGRYTCLCPGRTRLIS
jgi:hypothetical protein